MAVSAGRKTRLKAEKQRRDRESLATEYRTSWYLMGTADQAVAHWVATGEVTYGVPRDLRDAISRRINATLSSDTPGVPR